VTEFVWNWVTLSAFVTMGSNVINEAASKMVRMAGAFFITGWIFCLKLTG
jgi:hypothetical protein